MVYQHTRGKGKSSGDCIPYIYEREDGLKLHDWIRMQSFYNGEIYLIGGSYLSSVHLLCFPFEDDIKGAILEVQDSNRYNCNYRNGFYKIGLHGNWYVSMYKAKTIKNKNFNSESFKMLPLINFSKTVFNESSYDFDETLKHPSKDDIFWKSKIGGVESENALVNAHIPILLTTGFYDIYCGGIFDMWNNLDNKTKSMSTLLVHPYDHGGNENNQDIIFENGMISQQFANFHINWLNHIRNKTTCNFQIGKINYYRLFENKWDICDKLESSNCLNITLGDKYKTYKYDPSNPASFKGGLSCNFSGARYQDKPFIRDDIITIYTHPFDKDVFVKGKMKAILNVSTDCEDTCYYVRVSLSKGDNDFPLRDDINKISNFNSNYETNSFIDMEFTFDEHAFLIKKGERLRIDISSSAYPLYVPHCNVKGLFSLLDTYKIANNTVNLSKSILKLYYE